MHPLARTFSPSQTIFTNLDVTWGKKIAQSCTKAGLTKKCPALVLLFHARVYCDPLKSLNFCRKFQVKLIFNGKIIHRDAQKLSEAGIYDNCTVHCLVQRVSPADGGGAEGATSAGATPQSAHPGGQTGNPLNDVGSDLDLQTLCFPLLGTILFGCWWFALFYSQNFTMLSLTSLVSLTVLYAASVANLMFY